jgi:hypothetical protein
MNESCGSIRFTVEERILLHLLDFTKFKNKIEAPLTITQQGISQSIKVERKHLPRSLKAMHEKKLIVERKIHVSNKPQRMKTYHLTLNGEGKASELKEGIMDIIIKIKDEKGRIKEKTIRDVEKIVQGLYTLAEVLSCVQAESVFNLNQPIKSEKK